MGDVKKQRHHHDEVLADDLLYLIFSKLDKKNDRDSFGLTCHRFLDIQNSSRKRLELVGGTSDSCLAKLLNRFRQLESLSLCCCSDSGLTKLQLYGPKLHTLHLSFASNVTDLGLKSIASGCPLLSVITLYKCCSITDNGLNILTDSCKSLRQLDLGWCSSITDSGIWYLNRNCRQLTALRISGCDKILGETFRDLSSTLACLEAKHCAFSETGVSAVLSGGGLNYLNLSYPVRYPWGHELHVFDDLVYLATNLKFLDFENCTGLGDDDIMNISKACPLLQECNLSYCRGITLSGWQSVGLYCQNLEILHVNRCRYLCDRGLLALAKGCRRLLVIYLTNCHQITSSGISSFKIHRQDVELELEQKQQQLKHQITTTWAFTA